MPKSKLRKKVQQHHAHEEQVHAVEAPPAESPSWLAPVMVANFLLFGFVRFFGFDFLHASAATKLVNVATNLAAILMLASLGQINWPLGLAMMAANIAGSQFGSRLAIQHGSAFVRKAFLVIVTVLILKSAWNAYFSN